MTSRARRLRSLAGQAMQGLLANPTGTYDTAANMAKEAMECAVAMDEALEQQETIEQSEYEDLFDEFGGRL